MKRVNEALNGMQENYIYPFFWLHGEDGQILRNEIERIEECGIKGICLEARPHKDFVGPGWWKDLDLIIEECKKRGMKIWILDDSHFPTGFCNGEIKKHKELQKRYLSCKVYDFSGPMHRVQAVVSHCLRDPDDKIIAVVLAKKTGYEKIDSSEMQEISATMKAVRQEKKSGRPHMTVDFELPEGEWSLCVLTESCLGGEEQTRMHLDPMNPDATRLLLDTVYEPHYARYKEEFGTTILGFFSDEPRFGNLHGENASIGRNPDMALPWNAEIAKLLAKKNGMSEQEILCMLPLLFIGDCDKAHTIRYHYMDIVSELYAENFDGVIGEWCTAHRCEHTGHTIEDNNSASRLGYGAGHIYRAMRSQGRAGIDVVMHQLMPGMEKGYHKTRHKEGWDGEFFTYLLPKIGSGLAHATPHMNGQALCELFGAYGWAEGNRLCKWIADALLVRGINQFVPHAFDPAPYPDPDCPPHFYAHGNNPQYPEFGIVMQYMNRMSHMLSAGIHRAPAAILYHAEAEWSGAYMSAQKPAAVLTQNQIDYDVFSADILRKAEIADGTFRVNKEEFQVMIIPYAEALPRDLMETFAKMAEAGIEVILLEDFPVRSSEGEQTDRWLNRLMESGSAQCLPLCELVGYLKSKGIWEVEAREPQYWLRYYHYEQPDGNLYLFFNEGNAKEIDTDITIKRKGVPVVYDVVHNVIIRTDHPLHLHLAPGESVMLIYPRDTSSAADVKEEQKVDSLFEKIPVQEIELEDCRMELKLYHESEFRYIGNRKKPMYLQDIPGNEFSCGRIRYQFYEEMTGTEECVLELGGVREGAQVRVNDQDCGTCISEPYRYRLKGIKEGTNKIEVELNTTLAREEMDAISQYVPLEPAGMERAVLKIY